MGDETAQPSRRRVLKGAAAASAAAIVWSEPTIKGLARRPAYASATSSGETFETGAVGIGSVITGSGGGQLQVTAGGGNSYVIEVIGGAGALLTGTVVFIKNNGNESPVTLSGAASPETVSVTGNNTSFRIDSLVCAPAP